jgi:hypothetical protein
MTPMKPIEIPVFVVTCCGTLLLVLAFGQFLRALLFGDSP